MCIIAIKPKNADMFSDDEIKTMFYNNSDGCGYAYNDGKYTHMKKGYFKVDELLKDLHKIDFKGKDLLLHFRIATSGKTDVNNCHPFNVKSDLFFAHNGILADYVRKDDKSDTQHFNEDVLRKIDCYKVFKNDTANTLMKELINSNKLAFIDSKNYYLIGDFMKVNGRYYSNDSFKDAIQKFKYDYSDWDYYNDMYYSDDENHMDELIINGYTRFDNIDDFSEFINMYFTSCGGNLCSDDYGCIYKYSFTTLEIKTMEDNYD